MTQLTVSITWLKQRLTTTLLPRHSSRPGIQGLHAVPLLKALRHWANTPNFQDEAILGGVNVRDCGSPLSRNP